MTGIEQISSNSGIRYIPRLTRTQHHFRRVPLQHLVLRHSLIRNRHAFQLRMLVVEFVDVEIARRVLHCRAATDLLFDY